MATKAKPAPDRDQITVVKMYRAEARALAIIGDAHDLSQPDVIRRFFGAAMNAEAQAALDKQRAELAAAKKG